MYLSLIPPLFLYKGVAMAIGRPKSELKLTDGEQETLEAWTRRRTSAQALAQRARIVLLCATGKSNSEVAAELRVSKAMVGKWRNRFVAKRADGLLDEARPGAPRKISDKDVERVITLTL